MVVAIGKTFDTCGTDSTGRIEFWVYGKPQPGGSKTAFFNKHLGRSLIVDACKGNKEWRQSVSLSALAADAKPLDGPVEVWCTFYLSRPKGHYGKKGLLPSAPKYPNTKPDGTKLFRSTEDALKGIAWRDDSQVVDQHVSKRYGDVAGAHIIIEPIKDDT